MDLWGSGWVGCREEGLLGERHSLSKSRSEQTCRAMGEAARGSAWEGETGHRVDLEGSGETSVYVRHEKK